MITEAGVHPAVSHLVFLCALAIDADETCATAAAGDPGVAAISHAGRTGFGAALIVDDRGVATLDLALAAECFYNECDPDTVEWALARLGPESMSGLQQSPATVAWRTKPSTYVVCASDQGVHPDLQRLLARRCTTMLEWPADHSPFLSCPQKVADLLADRAGGG